MITSDKLKPWQLRPANELLRILKTNSSALDASDTGVGKTYIAVALAQALNIPCLVVVPKIAISGWLEVCRHFGEKLSVINYEKLRTGKSPYGSWSNQESLNAGRQFAFVCECCQRSFSDGKIDALCYTKESGIHCVVSKPRPLVHGKFCFNSGVEFLIFDEVHRCGGIDSLNSEMLIAAKRQGIKHLSLSATPAQTILALRALGYSLDLHCLDMQGLIDSNKRGAKLRVFHGWAAGYGAKRDPVFKGFVWRVSAEKQRTTMAEIRSQIIPGRGIRITTEQVPGFPENDIQAQLIDTDHENEISALYTEMAESLSKLSETASTDADPENPLTKTLRQRQKIELLKVPAAVDYAKDRLEQGFSIGLFVNFRATIEELSKRLDCPFIDGTVTGKARDGIIAEYQANRNRSLVLNSDACGISIGLQDLDGSFPRFGIVFPPWSATTFKQLVGRFPRDGGKSKSHFRVMFAAGVPVETRMYAALKGKLDNLSALCDADLMPDNLRL